MAKGAQGNKNIAVTGGGKVSAPVNYTLKKTYISSGRKARSATNSYSIHSDGKTLHEGAAKVTFDTQKAANDFMKRYNPSDKRYRWI